MPKDIEGILFFTLAEAAQQLGVTPTTLRSYVRQCRLKSERIGRAELIREQILKTYQANRESYKL